VLELDEQRLEEVLEVEGRLVERALETHLLRLRLVDRVSLHTPPGPELEVVAASPRRGEEEEGRGRGGGR
jgi:hypothetical protein